MAAVPPNHTLNPVDQHCLHGQRPQDVVQFETRWVLLHMNSSENNLVSGNSGGEEAIKCNVKQ